MKKLHIDNHPRARKWLAENLEGSFTVYRDCITIECKDELELKVLEKELKIKKDEAYDRKLPFEDISTSELQIKLGYIWYDHNYFQHEIEKVINAIKSNEYIEIPDFDFLKCIIDYIHPTMSHLFNDKDYLNQFIKDISLKVQFSFHEIEGKIRWERLICQF